LSTAQDAISNEVTTNPDKDKWGESTVMSGMAFLPVIDGELLTQRPIDAIAAGAGTNVPVLTGTNTEEYRLFLAPTLAALGQEKQFKDMLTSYGIEPAVPGVYDFYKSKLPANSKPFVIFSAVTSDFFFRIPACRVAEARTAADATTHMYEFAWRSPRKVPTQISPELGACHALELGFTFDTLDTASSITGPTPPQDLATAIHAAWVEFIKSGDPDWIPYDTTTRPVQTFKAEKIEIVNDPRTTEREKWKDFVTP
jgi:para-nitrobenzyl esterase